MIGRLGPALACVVLFCASATAAQTRTPDRVLRAMEEGLSALRSGDLGRSAELFDAVLTEIEVLWADSESARLVRSKWHEEGAKEFKGEAYERSAAFLYRGVVHLLAGEVEMARAAFKAGTLQDAFAEEEQYRCDFGTLFYLYALASIELGANELARQALTEATLVPGRPWYVAKDPPRERATVLLVETGTAPRKLPDGAGLAELVLRRGVGFSEETVEATCSGRARRFFPSSTDDFFFQASTRGGRPVERILEGKVVFQRKLEATGGAFGSAGDAAGLIAAAGGNADLGAAGALADLVGGFSRLIASNAKPRVDTRAWSNLPDRLHILFLPPGDVCPAVTVHYLDYTGAPIQGRKVEVTVPKSDKGLYQYLFVPSPTFG